MTDWYDPYRPEPEPRGLFDFLGAPEDTGAEFGDRMGVISQILMNLGSGRGGAGIGEAMGKLSERSTERRDKRNLTRMVNRAADKIESSNPEMAALMRANPLFGLKLLGQKYEQEWEDTSSMARLNKQYELAGANEIAQEREKARLKQEALNLVLQRAGLGGTISTPAEPAATGDIIPNNPESTSLGTGESEVVITPLSETSTVPAPDTGGGAEPPAVTAAPEIPREYFVGLPANKAAAKELLNQRLMHQDPEISVSDLNAYTMSLMDEDQTGRQKYFDNIAKRREVQARVAGFDTRTNEIARQNQALPGINLQTPGQPELMQAGIDPLDPTILPPNQVPQAAEYLRQANKAGEANYASALKDIMQPPSSGFSVDIDPVTGKVTGITQGGKTKKAASEGQAKAQVYYDQAVGALGELNKPESVEALATPSIETFNAMALPNGLATIMASDEFSVAQKSALAFVEAVVRYKSGAQITPSELEMNYQIFIPQVGELDKPKTLAFKQRQREKVARSIGANRSIDAIAEDGYDDLNAAIANGDVELTEKVVPPMEPWAIEAGITPEQWAGGSAEFWFPTDQKKKEE